MESCHVEAKPKHLIMRFFTCKQVQNDLRIALDFVPNKIADLKAEIEREIKQAEKEQEEAKRRLL